MAIFKAAFFFTQRKAGWSETWYLDRVDAAAALASMMPLVELRVRMLGGTGLGASDPRLESLRVSNILVDRDSLVYAVPPGDQFNSSVLGVADNPNLAMLVRCSGGPQYWRSWFLRGFPDSLVTSNGIYVPDPAWTPRFDAFVSAAKARFLGMVAWDRAAPVLQIATIDVPDPLVANRVLFTTTANHNLLPGDRFKVISAPGTVGVRGTHTVYEVASALSFRSYLKKAFTGAYIGGGKLTKKTPAFFSFTDMQIERVTHRITGRPFDLSAGRRRRRATA